MKEQNQQVHVVFTGKMEVYKDSEHLNRLKKIISENELENSVSLLGVIPREDQLCMMQNAKAVLQPSKFEGWNTTIEDAKSLQVPIIASGIAVHREQLKDKGTYFDAENPISLAGVLAHYSADKRLPLYEDYNIRVKIFAREFLHIFN